MRENLMMVGALALMVGCGIAGPQGAADDDEGDTSTSDSSGSDGSGANPASTSGSGADPTGGSGAGTSSSGAGAASSTATTSATTSTSSTAASSSSSSSSGSGGGSSGAGGSGGAGPDGCYTEGYDPSVSVSDLQSSYNSSQWLNSMLQLLSRRYHNGWYVLDQMKNDPWLANQFPQYFNLNSWAGMIDSVDTACHEEIHGYDFDQALSIPNGHLYFMGSNLQIQVSSNYAFFPRNNILSAVQQGGSVTSNYDSTYLTGTQGTYDFIFLADELTAYIGGLACATAIADQISGGASYRDGVAGHLYYLQVYLRIARTQHTAMYNQLKADQNWQDLVRFSWARGMYWLDKSAPFPQLGVNEGPILQRVNDPANLAEILQFTGDDAQIVACTP